MYHWQNFQLASRDLYAVLAVFLLALAVFLKIPLPYISAQKLLFLTIIFLLARAFLPFELTGYLLFFFLLAVLFSLFFPFFPLLLLILLLLFLFGFLRGR